MIPCLPAKRYRSPPESVTTRHMEMSPPVTVPFMRMFAAQDGVALAYHELGDPRARPLVLVHGLFSSAEVNWVRYGHAALLARSGFRVVMPDLRAHGQSSKPHEATAYPQDVLSSDGMALVAHLGLSDGGYDLGGFSLGARTVVQMLAHIQANGGAAPQRAIISGMGLSGLTSTGPRTRFFRHILDHPGSFARGTEEWQAEAFLKTTKGDRQALRLLLDSFTDTSLSVIQAIIIPVVVICGKEDNDNGSADALAALMPNARRITIPGTHMSCVAKPDLGVAIRDFLAEAAEA